MYVFLFSFYVIIYLFSFLEGGGNLCYPGNKTNYLVVICALNTSIRLYVSFFILCYYLFNRTPVSEYMTEESHGFNLDDVAVMCHEKDWFRHGVADRHGSPIIEQGQRPAYPLFHVQAAVVM